MDAEFWFQSIYVPSTCPHRARPAPPTRDKGRAAAGRAGSFNSGKEPIYSIMKRN